MRSYAGSRLRCLRYRDGIRPIGGRFQAGCDKLPVRSTKVGVAGKGDDRSRYRRQPLLCAGCERRSGRRRKTRHNENLTERMIRRTANSASGGRSGNALAVDQSATIVARTRSDRGKPASGESDLRQQAEVRSCGCREVGEASAIGPGVAVPDPSSGGRDATASDPHSFA